jgi:hypothetical protein
VISENPLIKEILNELTTEEIIFVDSFNLANRPVDCYYKLVRANQPNWNALD